MSPTYDIVKHITSTNLQVAGILIKTSLMTPPKWSLDCSRAAHTGCWVSTGLDKTMCDPHRRETNVLTYDISIARNDGLADQCVRGDTIW